MEERYMVMKRSWEEFRNAGMLWWVNRILHVFGWAICYETDNGKVTNVFPARVKYRGFSDKIEQEGYVKVSEYMRTHAEELSQEAKEE